LVQNFPQEFIFYKLKNNGKGDCLIAASVTTPVGYPKTFRIQSSKLTCSHKSILHILLQYYCVSILTTLISIIA